MHLMITYKFMEYLNSQIFVCFNKQKKELDTTQQKIWQCKRVQRWERKFLQSCYPWKHHISDSEQFFSFFFRGRVAGWFCLLNYFIQDLIISVPEKKNFWLCHMEGIYLWLDVPGDKLLVTFRKQKIDFQERIIVIK